MIFIDKGIIKDLIKNPTNKGSHEWLGELTESPKIPLVVASELIAESTDKIEEELFQNFIKNFEIIPHSTEDQYKALETFRNINSTNILEFNSVLVSETAKRHDAIIYTLNEELYKYIPNLTYRLPYIRIKQNPEVPIGIKIANILEGQREQDHFLAKAKLHIPTDNVLEEKSTDKNYKNDLEKRIKDLLSARVSNKHNDFNYNTLIPKMGVSSYEKALKFYTETLQFKIEYSRPEKGLAFLSLGASQLMIEQLDATTPATDQEFRAGQWRTGALEYPYGRGISLSLEVEDVDILVKRLQDASYALKVEPKNAWYRRDDCLLGQRQILVMDPDGYLLRFRHSLGTKPIIASTQYISIT